MTWYRNGRRIGDHCDVAQYMLDAVSTGSDPDADGWMMAFNSYIDSEFTPMEILNACDSGADYNGFFVDWIEDLAENDLGFGEEFGFEWRDDDE